MAFGVLSLVLLPVLASAQTHEAFDYFRTLTSVERDTFRLKVTYIGKQLGLPWSLILHAKSEPSDASGFDFLQHSFFEVNDLDSRSAAVTANDIEALVSSIGSLPSITNRVEGDGVLVSFSMLVRLPSRRGFELILDPEVAQLLFDRMRFALAENHSAFRLIPDFACGSGLLQPERPVDVSSSVGVEFSSLRRWATSDRFVAVATVRNTSETRIEGPVSLVLDHLLYETKLVNGSGWPCGTDPQGKPYLNIDSAAAGIAPGQDVEVKLEFANDYPIPYAAARMIVNAFAPALQQPKLAAVPTGAFVPRPLESSLAPVRGSVGTVSN